MGVTLLDTVARCVPASSLALVDKLKGMTIHDEEDICWSSTHAWFKPLCRSLIDVMVRLSDLASRLRAYKLLTYLFSTLSEPSRFETLTQLATTCPFPNVTSLLIDQVREATVAQWNHHPHLLSQTSVTTTTSLLVSTATPIPQKDDNDDNKAAYLPPLSIYEHKN